MGAAGLQPFRRRLSRGGARRAEQTRGRLRAHAHARSGRAQRLVFMAGGGGNSDRRWRPSMLGRDPGAGVRPGARAVRRGGRRRLRHGDRHSGGDRRARVGGRLRQVDGDAPCRGGKFPPCARGEGIRIRRRARGADLWRRATGRRARGRLTAARGGQAKRPPRRAAFPSRRLDTRYAAMAAALREER